MFEKRVWKKVWKFDKTYRQQKCRKASTFLIPFDYNSIPHLLNERLRVRTHHQMLRLDRHPNQILTFPKNLKLFLLIILIHNFNERVVIINYQLILLPYRLSLSWLTREPSLMAAQLIVEPINWISNEAIFKRINKSHNCQNYIQSEKSHHFYNLF